MALIYCDRCSVYAQHRYDLFAVCLCVLVFIFGRVFVHEYA